MEMRTTSASAQSPACSVTACKLRERIYAPHERLCTLVDGGGTKDRPLAHPWGGPDLHTGGALLDLLDRNGGQVR
jgi:hypothetical protein